MKIDLLVSLVRSACRRLSAFRTLTVWRHHLRCGRSLCTKKNNHAGTMSPRGQMGKNNLQLKVLYDWFVKICGRYNNTSHLVGLIL